VSERFSPTQKSLFFGLTLCSLPLLAVGHALGQTGNSGDMATDGMNLGTSAGDARSDAPKSGSIDVKGVEGKSAASQKNRDLSGDADKIASAKSQGKKPVAERIQGFFDKGFVLKSGDGNYSLKVGARFHLRLTYLGKDMGVDDNNKPLKRENQAYFSLPVARLNLGGNLFTPNLTYRFEADFGKGMVALLDAYADYCLIKNWLNIRAGVWKRPFARQFMQSSGKMSMPETSFVNGYFNTAYDIGLALHNGYDKSPPFEYALGLFNGQSSEKPILSGKVTIGETGQGDLEGQIDKKAKFSNSPEKFFHPMVVARAGYNHGPIAGYSEGDLEGGPLRFSIAANLLLDFDYDNDNQSGISAGLDFMLKVRGFSLSGALFAKSAQKAYRSCVTIDGESVCNGDTTFADQQYAAMGFYLQGSYLIGKHVEPVLRFSLLSPAKQGAAMDKSFKSVHESGFGVAIYFFRHDFKWLLMGAVRTNGQLLDTLKRSKHDYVDGRMLTELVISI
jgi:hypothetical protein